MLRENSTLTTFYKSWKEYQDHLRQAIAPLSSEQLALRAAPGIRSIGEIVAHIIRARVHWFFGVLGESGEEIAPLIAWNKEDAPRRTTSELVQGLDASWNFMSGLLARWNSEDMQKTFRDKDGGHDVSRSWVVWHIIEHDLHHGGEVSLTLGMHGLQAPDV